MIETKRVSKEEKSSKELSQLPTLSNTEQQPSVRLERITTVNILPDLYWVNTKGTITIIFLSLLTTKRPTQVTNTRTSHRMSQISGEHNSRKVTKREKERSRASPAWPVTSRY